MKYLEPEFADAYKAWRTEPTPRQMSNLLTTLSPVMQSALRTYAGANATSPTLKSRAKLLSINALQTYDPNKAKLKSHLFSHLQGLQRSSAEENQIISVPERVRLDRHRLYTAESSLRELYGREPSDMEISDHSGLSLKRIGHVRGGVNETAEAALAATDDRGRTSTSFIPTRSDKQNNTWLSFIYHDLQPTDQVIMEHTFGLHGKPVLKKNQIAAKLGVSPGLITQRGAKIQAMLDDKPAIAERLFGG